LHFFLSHPFCASFGFVLILLFLENKPVAFFSSVEGALFLLFPLDVFLYILFFSSSPGCLQPAVAFMKVIFQVDKKGKLFRFYRAVFFLRPDPPAADKERPFCLSNNLSIWPDCFSSFPVVIPGLNFLFVCVCVCVSPRWSCCRRGSSVPPLCVGVACSGGHFGFEPEELAKRPRLKTSLVGS